MELHAFKDLELTFKRKLKYYFFHFDYSNPFEILNILHKRTLNTTERFELR